MLERICRAAAHSTLLRTLAFVRVKSPFATRYNIVYPGLLSAFSAALVFLAIDDISIFSRGGLLSSIVPFLSILAPFYVAALAAVSTFSGKPDFDEKFKMTEPVTLNIPGERGIPEEVEITQRHFLSLLFGYCCVVSLALLLFSIAVPVFTGAVSIASTDGLRIIKSAAFLVYSFALFQVIILTLLAVYYLADKIHRSW